MGIMRSCLLVALFCSAASALPNGRILRPEEHWRPATARDISMYIPRHPVVEAKKTKIKVAATSFKSSKSSYKASNYDLASECGIEGPPSKDRIVGGSEAEPNQWPCSSTTPGSVEDPSSPRTTS